MAEFLVYSCPCTFERTEGGATVFSYMLTAPHLVERRVDVRSVAALEEEMRQVADETQHDGSFFVGEILIRGQRAPNGYRTNRPKRIEVDRDTVA